MGIVSEVTEQCASCGRVKVIGLECHWCAKELASEVNAKLGERLSAALDALHAMVEQYCGTGDQTESGAPVYNDMCMSAPEEACQVLQNEGRITSEQW